MPPSLSIRVTTTAILAVGLMIGSSAFAAPKSETSGEPARAQVLQSVADCRKLTEDAPRLACYDKAVAALDQAESKGQVVVIDREQVKTVRRQAFGLTLPAFTLFNKGAAKDEQLDRVIITLEKAYLEAGRHWVFVSTEGVVWVQTDDESILNEPHAGSTVAIRKAALSSFFCNVDGQRAVRCERRR